MLDWVLSTSQVTCLFLELFCCSMPDRFFLQSCVSEVQKSFPENINISQECSLDIAIKVKAIHWTTLVRKYLHDAVFPVTFQHFVKRQTVNHYLSLRTNLIILSLAFFICHLTAPWPSLGHQGFNKIWKSSVAWNRLIHLYIKGNTTHLTKRTQLNWHKVTGQKWVGYQNFVRDNLQTLFDF